MSGVNSSQLTLSKPLTDSQIMLIKAESIDMDFSETESSAVPEMAKNAREHFQPSVPSISNGNLHKMVNVITSTPVPTKNKPKPKLKLKPNRVRIRRDYSTFIDGRIGRKPKHTIWNDEQEVMFLSLVEPHSILWDTKHPQYRDSDIKRKIWKKEVLEPLRREFPAAPEKLVVLSRMNQKLSNIRIKYHNELKKIRSGCARPGIPTGQLYKSPWRLFDICRFLDGDGRTNDQTTTNLSVLVDDSDEPKSTTSATEDHVELPPLPPWTVRIPRTPVQQLAREDQFVSHIQSRPENHVDRPKATDIQQQLADTQQVMAAAIETLANNQAAILSNQTAILEMMRRMKN